MHAPGRQKPVAHLRDVEHGENANEQAGDPLVSTLNRLPQILTVIVCAVVCVVQRETLQSFPLNEQRVICYLLIRIAGALNRWRADIPAQATGVIGLHN